MLSDIFENFRNKCIEIYEHDPAHFFICTWISMTSFLKNAEVQLELFTDNVLLMMVEKGIGDGIRHATYRYAKANNKYLKNYNKIIDLSYSCF